jgi:hypothetical protein
MAPTTPYPFQHHYATPFMPSDPADPAGFRPAWKATVEMMAGPETRALARERYAARDPEGVYLSGMLEFVHHGFCMAHATVVHAPDEQLIAACERSTFPASLRIVDFPFLSRYPAWEFRPPVSSGLPPLILLNLGARLYARYRDASGKPAMVSTRGEEEGWWIAYIPTEDPINGKEFVYAFILPPDNPVSQAATHHSVAIPENVERVRKALEAYLLAAQQARDRMTTTPAPRDSLPGAPGTALGRARRRTHLTIPPLFSNAAIRYASSERGTGGAKAPHLRAAHFRVLAHQRYTRNPDGSPRMIFIDMCEVTGRGEQKRKERKI